jgi:hypothetical protein
VLGRLLTPRVHVPTPYLDSYSEMVAMAAHLSFHYHVGSRCNQPFIRRASRAYRRN